MEHPFAPLQEAIADAARVAGFELSAHQMALALLHVREMLTWNRVAHLTTVTDPAGVGARHFLEAFMAASLLPPIASGAPLRVVDVGSGAGFPGLGVKLVRPEIALTLLEPRERKAAFLAAMARQQKQPRPVVLRKRAEEVEGDFDVVMSRAVRLRPRVLQELVAAGGVAILFGASLEDELADALQARGWLEQARRDLAIPGQVVRSLRRPA